MQKQAVLVCSVCALAAILTIAITMTLLKRGKTPAAPGEQPSSEVLVPGEEDISDHYQISETSAALLPETADAGESYQKETLFLGDSNTVRLYANGLISLQQFCAKEGIGTHAALNEGIVTFKKDSNTYTIAQAVAKMKPRRVVIMLGTNDTKERLGANACAIGKGLRRLVRKAQSIDCWAGGQPNLLIVAPPAIGKGVERSPVAQEMGLGCVEKSLRLPGQFRAVAAETRCHFLDANALGLAHNPIDFMHLTRESHARLAAALAERIPTLF